MNYFSMISILIVVLSGIVYALIRIVRKEKSKTILKTFNNEEKALYQINRYYKRFVKQKKRRVKQNLFLYFKHLKIILAVYMKEKHDVTIRDTLSSQLLESLEQEGHSDIKSLQSLFVELTKERSKNISFTIVEQLYQKAIGHFAQRCDLNTHN